MSGQPTRRPRRPRSRAALVLGIILTVVPSGAALGEDLGRPVVTPGQALPVRAAEAWTETADVFDRAGAIQDPFYVSADAASTLASRVSVEGWHAPDIPGLVTALLATANPDGGYGLGKPWDAFQDGTVNPASTSYGATTAGHVGPVLLAGYEAGVIPVTAVERAMDSLLDLPLSDGGRCVPYSNSPYDANEPCVWNVLFGVADWVHRAALITGYRMADAQHLADVATSWLPQLGPDPATGYWSYSSAATGPQDLGHQLWTALAVDRLTGTQAAMTLMLGRPLWRVQVRRLHDASVAAALGGIALYDCRYATDPLVLADAGSTVGAAPYALKAMAAQARETVQDCFRSGRVSAAGAGASALVLPDLG